MSIEPIRETVAVRDNPDRVFALFTEHMGTWWPVEEYSRAVSEFADDNVLVDRLEFQPRLGGQILEHLSDGRVLPWGEVSTWEPPRRVVVAWRPHSMPEPPTELDVVFTAQGDITVVDLEHRGWDRLSDGFRETLYGIYARGWVTTLRSFASVEP